MPTVAKNLGRKTFTSGKDSRTVKMTTTNSTLHDVHTAMDLFWMYTFSHYSLLKKWKNYLISPLRNYIEVILHCFLMIVFIILTNQDLLFRFVEMCHGT